ncbi:SulP family inorganic anion transporter [Oceanibaculum indicum]|uniref:SulP family sulfate permease n=1 Tax=Oceanibaculum indicum TaxID=526216 RepID=A0A420WHC1_9PROT|nr:sulfate permease [Oceanibaculum indicum]RKQ70393.1 SulP family sulfate permease [Oceanibaculum indicum]
MAQDPAAPPPADPARSRSSFTPKLVTALQEGYGFGKFRQDAIAGLTVAIVALPLAMALAIASGTTPERGLFTAIIAGFLISALGGSRFQIGGPTGAFVVVVFNVIDRHGYDGLVIATIMAGIMLLAFGLLRFGTYIKYVPQPVVTGFTAGIAVIIFSSQVRDLLGLEIERLPADFLHQWEAYLAHLSSVNFAAVGLAALTLAIILGLKRWRPRWPGFLIGVLAGTLLAYALGLPVETIGSRFGEIPNMLPSPSLPDMSLERIRILLPDAFTIALLAGIESLLSAMVADGMTGRRHRSNGELMAQGIANIGSAMFGGIPATGAIARTATNIRSGAVSPVAGMLHALFLLVFMVALAHLMVYVPLACLAAVLVVVAWNMSEADRFRHLMKAPHGDRLVLLLTFGLTVLVDLTVAIQVGIVLAAILFMVRMAEAVEVQGGVNPLADDDDGDEDSNERENLPPGVEVFLIRGPLFFGASGRLTDVLERVGATPKVFILRLRHVPLMDASGAGTLEAFLKRCQSQGTTVILSGLQPQPAGLMSRMGLLREGAGAPVVAADYRSAVAAARTLTGGD